MRAALFSLAIALAAAPLLAQEPIDKKKEKSKIKAEAVLEVGADINNKVNKGETDYRKIGKAKIDISGRYAESMKAEFGLEYDYRDSSFAIDKLYAHYAFSDVSAARAGYMKKALGLEEKAGIDERLFHRRSIINEGLEDFGFLGHDLTLQYRRDAGDGWKLAGGLAWAHDTLRFLQNYSIEREAKNSHFMMSAIVRHYARPDSSVLTTYAAALSYKRSAKRFAGEAEITLGKNPAIKAFEGRDAYIGGLRLQEYFPLKSGFKAIQQVIPVAEAALYSEDLDMDNRNYEAQFRAGLVIVFVKKHLQWRNAYGNIVRVSDGEKELRRRRFDSEVVAMF